MSRTQQRPARPDTVVELRGGVQEDLVDYARRKVAGALAHTGRPVLHSRVRVTRHGDPARERPVVAQVNVDLNGRPVRVQVEATTPREAVDLLVDRLAHRLERVTGSWEARHARRFEEEPHERRHDSHSTRSRSYYDRPPDERRIVQHKTVSPAACSVDEAVVEMGDLDHDFHLFVEVGRGVDSLVYRGGPTGIRLAQIDGRAGEVRARRRAGDGEHRVPATARHDRGGGPAAAHRHAVPVLPRRRPRTGLRALPPLRRSLRPDRRAGRGDGRGPALRSSSPGDPAAL